MRISEAEFNQLISAAREFDAWMARLEMEATTRRLWVRASDGWYWYAGSESSAGRVLQ